MSSALIARNPDLHRLLVEGYGPRIVDDALVIGPVPFVDADGTVGEGWLATPLTMAGDRTVRPSSHTAWFAGGTPHDADGAPLHSVINSADTRRIGGRQASFMLSAKPREGYPDHYEKVSTYADTIAKEARRVEPTATARSHPTLPPDPDSPLSYLDTASTRAGIAMGDYLGKRVGLVGMGGTASYILDIVAKTPIAEIHLWDGDRLLQHNALRGPGCASSDELAQQPYKVDHWAGRYRDLHSGIHAHPEMVTEANVDQLRDLDFVFLALDDNDARRLVAGVLVKASVPFVDSGIGMSVTPNGMLDALVRTTTGLPGRTDHLDARLPKGDLDDGLYGNIQTSDMNMLAAALSLVAWRKHMGTYHDDTHEAHSVMVVHGSEVIASDTPPDAAEPDREAA